MAGRAEDRVMGDVAAEADGRGIAIRRVGVRGVHLPALIRTKGGGEVQVLASIDMTADLPQEYRGTHMSRFVRVLNEWRDRRISALEMKDILAEVRAALQAQRCDMALRFKYFLEKRAPVSGTPSELDYDCEFDGVLEEGGYHFTLGVVVPVTTVCPCSREVSDYGAHGQRARISVRLRAAAGHIVWIEDLVPLLEQQGSCEIFPVLRREDEKWVTERAFRNPKFVEDVVRDTIAALRGVPRVTWFEVGCEVFESIHNHNAYAWSEESQA